MNYDDFELQLGPLANEGLFVRVLSSPAGQGEAWVDPQEILEVARPWLDDNRNFSPDPLTAAGSATVVGDRLFRALFSGAIGELFHQSLGHPAEGQLGRPLRIRLHISPRDRGLAFLQRLPWELLYREATADFLALSRHTPVVRYLDIPRPVPPPPVIRPLSVLLLSSQAVGSPQLGLSRELAALEAALAMSREIEVHVLHSPDSQALRRALEARPVHVLHFMGHGTFDRASGEGALLLAGRDGLDEVVTGRHLATKINDFPSLRLAVLNACETAAVSAEAAHSPFTGVAAALVLGGVPAVVAMQRPIADSHAIAFSAAFYEQLAKGAPIEEALTEGRQAIHSVAPEGAEWAIPALFLRTPSGRLFAPVEATGAAPKPPAPMPSRSRALATGAAATALAAGMGLLVALEGWPPWPEPDPGQKQPTKLVATNADGQEPRPVAPASAGAASLPETTRPPAARGGGKGEVVSLGGATGLRLQVRGAPEILSTLTAALRQAAQPLLGSGLLPEPGTSGPFCVEVSLLAPVHGSYQEAGQTFTTCALTADLRLCGPGGSALARVPVTRSDAYSGEACDSAAEALAPEVVARLAQYLKEGST